jgi:hypothetical protein
MGPDGLVAAENCLASGGTSKDMPETPKAGMLEGGPKLMVGRSNLGLDASSTTIDGLVITGSAYMADLRQEGNMVSLIPLIFCHK